MLNPITTTKTKESNPLGLLYAPVAEELKQVEKLLASELSSRFPEVDRLLRKCNRLSGKRLRPALLLLIGKACGDITTEHLTLAVAMEMIHTATLIHDDVLDNAEQRRHAQTLNCEHGNHSAILTGDFLFSQAFYLTSTLPTTFASQEIGLATKRVCEGEIRQIGTRENYHLSEPDYIEIIDAKTAVLCSCSAKLGAHYAQASTSLIHSAALYGTELGIAFQIVDDLLDVTGSEQETGKSLGTDLQQRKPTLPLIHSLSSADEKLRDRILLLLERPHLNTAEILECFEETESLKYSRQRARQFAANAMDHADQFPANDATDVLKSIAEFVLHRAN